MVMSVGTLPALRSLQTTMTINLPRREKSAAKTGPSLDISPLELRAQLENQHGLSSLLTSATTWEPFAWKGNDLSAPVRALWVAEARGLLQRRNDRAVDIAVADIAADINTYLMQFGKKPVSEASVLNNLRTAALYLQAAVGITIVTDRQAMTVRLVDNYESEENIKRYVKGAEAKLKKLRSELVHADAMGYEVSAALQAAEDATGVRLAIAGSPDA